jgi:D-alanyl-D-alanine carboxypeptidase
VRLGPLMTAAMVTGFSALFVTGCFSAQGQSGRSTNSDQQTTGGVDSQLAATLQNILDENRELFAAGAASAAVVIPGQGTWLGASGVANPKTGEPVTTDTAFALGSVTKTFIAALVLKLSEEGVLGLDDPLTRWVPRFPGANRITIRQLLNHTSGVFNMTDNRAFIETQIEHPRERWTARRILSYVGPPLFPPGTNWGYSNTNYILLGLVVERATGSSVAAELRRTVLEPAGAERVFLQSEEDVSAPVVRSAFDIDDDGDADELSDGTTTIPNTALATAAWTAGGLAGTPEAMAAFGDALFGGRVIPRSLLSAMTDFSQQLGLGRGGGLGYGFGISKFEIPDHEVFGHGGSIPGFRSALWYVADEGVTIAFCWNDAELDPTLVIQPLLDEVTRYLRRRADRWHACGRAAGYECRSASASRTWHQKGAGASRDRRLVITQDDDAGRRWLRRVPVS